MDTPVERTTFADAKQEFFNTLPVIVLSGGVLGTVFGLAVIISSAVQADHDFRNNVQTSIDTRLFNQIPAEKLRWRFQLSSDPSITVATEATPGTIIRHGTATKDPCYHINYTAFRGTYGAVTGTYDYFPGVVNMLGYSCAAPQ